MGYPLASHRRRANSEMSLKRMVEELLAARGIDLTYETVRRWSVKFGLGIARRIRSTALARGDKWHLDEG
jgi:putative transposase